ncbi:hypothetical protein NEUTE1DRAFT_107908 [Neurospora tetrasperma FGSC 2508]|uniref:Uncharacterized protein n=1 Tax=Neurospora tetrasperma (strain FGSC 2508 / ATCC MYA-4615 / P0657) TaxID=510951 RepID=F8MD78_NEUT8|nr:uncharacterized protein NEUTE1DRAFT_107908 [Neurospora tetrasperma FGSC 2508]EGO61423.1 hypothetical protein NEUTE1DRAFT_107908 [Neurospora tetrasperma FGSC 2508]
MTRRDPSVIHTSSKAPRYKHSIPSYQPLSSSTQLPGTCFITTLQLQLPLPTITHISGGGGGGGGGGSAVHPSRQKPPSQETARHGTNGQVALSINGRSVEMVVVVVVVAVADVDVNADGEKGINDVPIKFSRGE